MNAADATLTARHLCIPRSVARRYARHGALQGLDLDDLHSVANEAFARALANWRPSSSPPGPDPLGGYLHWRVERAVVNHVWLQKRARRDGTVRVRDKREDWWRSRVSLDAPSPADGGRPYSAVVGARADPALAAVDDADEVERLLAPLPSVERRVVVILAAGHTQTDLARWMSRSRERLRQLVARARGRLLAANGEGVTA